MLREQRLQLLRLAGEWGSTRCDPAFLRTDAFEPWPYPNPILNETSGRYTFAPNRLFALSNLVSNSVPQERSD